jgi:hypothetical protein
VPIERDEAGRRLRLRRRLGRVQGVFKQAEHGEAMHLSTVLGQTVAAAAQRLFSDYSWICSWRATAA